MSSFRNSSLPTGGLRTLNDEQLKYAASDVLHLHRLKQKFDELLEREGRAEIAAACFKFPADDKGNSGLYGLEDPIFSPTVSSASTRVLRIFVKNPTDETA